jgi:pilus assembly protein CpaB
VEIIKTTVITAAENIPENTIITKEMIQSKSVPIDEKISGVYSNIDDVVGKISGTEILAGEQVVDSRLVDTGNISQNSFAYKIPEGMRTWTCSVSPLSGVSGLLKVGDHVDILCNYMDDETTENKLRVIGQNMEIIALDKNITSATEKKSSSDSAPATYSTVTFICTSDQLKLFQAAVKYGEIYMTLRNPKDTEEVSIQPVTKDILQKFGEETEAAEEPKTVQFQSESFGETETEAGPVTETKVISESITESQSVEEVVHETEEETVLAKN